MAGQTRLYCLEAGTKGKKGSIILLHGALGSGDDFARNVPYLEHDYHLLMPDLPRHGKSHDVTPYTTTLASDLCAALITERAENRRAHVIGFSMGMSVALNLIARFPELINDVLITGYRRLPPSKYMPYGFWLSGKVESLIPRAVTSWLMDGTQPPEVQPTHNTLSLSKDIMANLPNSGNEWPAPWPAKTLIMCAGKAGIVPSADQADAAVKLRDIARTMNPETVAYTHPLMRHPWLWQDPKLFADTARMWFEQGKVPDGFVEL